MSERPLSDVILEEELLEILGVSKTVLFNLRKNGLPFVHLAQGRRVYVESSVRDWLIRNQENSDS